MQMQDTSFVSLLLIMALLPLVAKGLAEVYIKIVGRLQQLRHKHHDGKPVIF
jgi:hypothetical protein